MGNLLGVLNVPEVVPAGLAALGVLAAEVEARAQVAHVAVRVGDLPPVAARAREARRALDRVEGVDAAELLERQRRELVFQEGVRFANGVRVPSRGSMRVRLSAFAFGA